MGFFDDKGMFGIDMNLDGKVTVEDDLLFMAMVDDEEREERKRRAEYDDEYDEDPFDEDF